MYLVDLSVPVEIKGNLMPFSWISFVVSSKLDAIIELTWHNQTMRNVIDLQGDTVKESV